MGGKGHAHLSFSSSWPREVMEGADELLEVDHAIYVVVKDVEDVLCELARVAKGEELL